MSYNQFYLAATIPQWSIFVGIVLVIIGYIDKKEWWMTSGWIILIVTGLISLYFNLTGNPVDLMNEKVKELITAGWQCATGAVLAAISYLFQRRRNRYFRILGILTLLYFMLVFFQFNSIMRSRPSLKPPQEENDHTKQSINKTMIPESIDFVIKNCIL